MTPSSVVVALLLVVMGSKMTLPQALWVWMLAEVLG